jgi:hypothetical protein
VEGLHLPLLLVGYVVGVAVYGAIAVTLWRGARSGAAGLVAFYWRRRSRRENVAQVRRMAHAQDPPARQRAA